jgi:hypothetical protein
MFVGPLLPGVSGFIGPQLPGDPKLGPNRPGPCRVIRRPGTAHRKCGGRHAPELARVWQPAHLQDTGLATPAPAPGWPGLGRADPGGAGPDGPASGGFTQPPTAHAGWNAPGVVSHLPLRQAVDAPPAVSIRRTAGPNPANRRGMSGPHGQSRLQVSLGRASRSGKSRGSGRSAPP